MGACALPFSYPLGVSVSSGPLWTVCGIKDGTSSCGHCGQHLETRAFPKVELIGSKQPKGLDTWKR